jgi:hypothetical protein
MSVSYVAVQSWSSWALYENGRLVGDFCNKSKAIEIGRVLSAAAEAGGGQARLFAQDEIGRLQAVSRRNSGLADISTGLDLSGAETRGTTDPVAGISPRMNKQEIVLGVLRCPEGWGIFDRQKRLRVFQNRITAISSAERMAGEARKRGRSLKLLVQDAKGAEVGPWIPNAQLFEDDRVRSAQS